jgi:predicted outer membrane repeat protein
MIRFLILNGADVHLIDSDGKAALELTNEENTIVFMEAVIAFRQNLSQSNGAAISSEGYISSAPESKVVCV